MRTGTYWSFETFHSRVHRPLRRLWPEHIPLLLDENSAAWRRPIAFSLACCKEQWRRRRKFFMNRRWLDDRKLLRLDIRSECRSRSNGHDVTDPDELFSNHMFDKR